MILDIIVSGLISGSTYAILALGFSLIFGVARIVNIAHTAFYMLAAYVIYVGTYKLGVHPVIAMIVAIVLITFLGIICYKFFIEPIREREAAVLIATIALAMVIQESMLLGFGGHYLSVHPLIEGYMEISSVKIMYQQVLTIGIAFIALAVIWAWLVKTRTGLAIRSTAQDREVANLMGMDEGKVAVITMGVSVGLAAFTGAIVVPLTVLNPFMWMHPLVMMMAAVVLGGMGSLKGSFVGAYILGFTEALVVFLLPGGAYLKVSVALLIMVLVLVVRPEGLFGVFFEEER
ncbi:MAG: branched-chain amino acid ABC transporter permease [Deltaproteobacteria bacterium]|nr:branched-chain amino acid ABC transporter permease [Deltaproteobacteria bacterium]